MPGTPIGGRHAAETNKKRYGADFYREIGRKGGQVSRGGGFAANPELAREAGRKGGKASKRGSTNAEVNALQAEKQKDQKFWRRLRHIGK